VATAELAKFSHKLGHLAVRGWLTQARVYRDRRVFSSALATGRSDAAARSRLDVGQAVALCFARGSQRHRCDNAENNQRVFN